MVYVLEWRADAASTRADAGVVCHVRIFRVAASLKAFASRRAFARHPGLEFRLTRRDRTHAPRSVITTRAAILAWDERKRRLPVALAHSAWAGDLDRLAALGEVRARLAAALALAERAQTLTRKATAQIRALFEALVVSEGP